MIWPPGEVLLNGIVEQILENFGEAPAVRRDIRQAVLQNSLRCASPFRRRTLRRFQRSFSTK